MGKGSNRRPPAVSREEYEQAWERTFGGGWDAPPDHEDWQRSREMSNEAMQRLLKKRKASRP